MGSLRRQRNAGHERRRWLDRAVNGRGAPAFVFDGGTGISPVFDFDPVTDRVWSRALGVKTVAQTVTTGRTGAGYYTNRDGTLTNFANSVVRIGSNGMLVEGARTNLALQSQTFDNASWTKSDTSITANAVAAPDGTTTADKIVENALLQTHQISQTVTVVSATAYAYSIYAKAAERSQVYMQYFDGVTNKFPVFSLVDGTKVADGGIGSAWSAESLANGWWRFTILVTSGSTSTSIVTGPATAGSPNYQGDGTSGIYVWGAQLEVANCPSSYIPTTTVAVTRTADGNLDVAGTQFDAIFGTNANGPFTFYVEARGPDAGPPGDANGTYFEMSAASRDTARVFGGSNPGSNPRIGHIMSNASFAVASEQPLGGEIGVTGAFNRSAYRAASLDAAQSVNGSVAVNAINSNPWPDGPMEAIQIGTLPGGPLDGYLRRLTIWNVGLSNADLQRVSSGGTEWTLEGDGFAPDLDMDMVQNRAWDGATEVTPASLLTCTRAAPALTYAEDSAGRLIGFAANTPRITNKGLLVEEERTNSILRSQEFDNTGAWPTSNSMTAIANGAVAPDGTATADLVTAGVAGQPRYETSGPAAATYTLSLYFQAVSAGFIGFGWYDGVAEDNFISFNLSTGAHALTEGSAFSNPVSQTLANGWYRISVTLTSVSGGGSGIKWLMNDTSSLGSTNDVPVSAYWWGAQREIGTFATSYIPTTTVAVTRADELVDFTTTTWFNGSTDTAYFEWIGAEKSSIGMLLSTTGGTNDQYYREFNFSPPDLSFSAANDGGLSLVPGNTALAGSVMKAAAATTVNDGAASLNGGAVATDAAFAIAGASSAIGVGYYISNSAQRFYINSYIKRIAYWNTRLANATLQTLTTP